MAIQSEKMKLIGMRCVGCEQAIEEAVRKIPGVGQVKASYSDTSLPFIMHIH